MERRLVAGTRRFALLALVALLDCGLVWGLATAFGSSASPSPAAGRTLRIGWTSEPDNLNPFIGYTNDTYEIWALNYSTLFGCGDHNQPTLDLASRVPDPAERRHLGGRQGLDHPHPHAASSGRTACP